ncbi:hypothetical protein [Pedobacter caeni]|uniref:Uncharacterized protein n=1 Tax=Pedobacter caeni TaxID=288992 RepID=A0A1M4V4G5_9SPHI|nr:hypothetical protein [Pedobacter caeni]SHE63835.1 hypothetical protein SAMN04488522_101774 [Pedobacter caeni]
MAYSIKKEEVIKYEPNELRNFRLFTHEYIDNLNFTFKPAHFLSNAEEYIKVASELFKKAGWAGDGEIELIWVPPFMLFEFTSNEDAFGIVIWHVKQEEDGISWLLSPKRLPLDQ